MFTVVINLKDVGKYERFSEAFRVFFGEFKKAVKSGSAIPHTLEAASFITCPFFGKTLESVMDFFFRLRIWKAGRASEDS